MLKRILAGAFGLVLMGMSGSAQALVVEGTLYDTTYDDINDITHDYWYFTVTGGTYSFDILSWEPFGSDVNGDGEYAFIDSMIWLYTDDGNLDGVDEIALNDDYFGTPGDGSLSPLDSFLEIILAPGDYVLAVGTCCTRDDFLDGVLDGYGPGDVYGWNENGELTANFMSWNAGYQAHGDYQLTIEGEGLRITQAPNQIPEPATFALFGIGLAGIGFTARRRRKEG